MINKNIELDEYEINKEKIKYLDIQILATIGLIITTLISLILSFDKKLSLENKKKLFSNSTAQDIALLQTIIVLIISIEFLYSNYEQYKLSKKNNSSDQQDLLLQIQTSIFAVISAIIGLYIVFKNYPSRTLTIAEAEIT